MTGRSVQALAIATAEKIDRCSYRREAAMGAKYFRPCSCVVTLICIESFSYSVGFFLHQRPNPNYWRHRIRHLRFPITGAIEYAISDSQLLAPTLATIQARDEDGHGLVCRPGLHLVIAAFSLLALTTLEPVRRHFLVSLQELLLTQELTVR